MASKFYNKIKFAKEEREVEDVYNEGLNLYFKPDIIEHPYKCDGYISKNGINLLIEYKYDMHLKVKVDQAKVLVQVIYYLKQFELSGRKLPSVILVGDINECFVLHANLLLDYLDFENVDWATSPSTAYMHNIDMLNALVADENINPFVYDIDEEFSFKVVADFIANLSNNTIRKVRITPQNVESIFNYFVLNCIKDASKYSANDLVGIFMGVLTDKEHYYIHPNNKNKLITQLSKKEVVVDGKVFKSVFSHFDDNLSWKQKKELIAMSDRLIKDTERRFNGAFYTPSEFADYSQKMISESLGDDWREKYVVWDCCSGTKNLTRDYNFSKLYCSTLEQSELDQSIHYNTNATSFQYDFLNDDLEKLPKSLIQHFENNDKIIFYINPPYAQAGINGAKGESKKDCAKTKINEVMKSNKVGASSQNLIAQFLYHIYMIKKRYNLTNISVGYFSNPLLTTAENFSGLRDIWFDEFKFDRGIVFNAGHFADVSAKWGITFEIWNSGVQTERNYFPMNIVDLIDGEVKAIGSKVMYNADNMRLANEWMKEPMKGEKATKDHLMLSSGCQTRKTTPRGSNYENNVGYFFNDMAICQRNGQGVALFSATYGHGHGVTEKNIDRVVSLFSARRIISQNFINSADSYLKPNTDDARYGEWQNDAFVYSLFDSKSNQTSLRKIEYKGKEWDISNEWFWMKKSDIADFVYNNLDDANIADFDLSKDRYMSKWMDEHYSELSVEAKAVIDKATELVKKSFHTRRLFDMDKPQYQVQNWDCGWYQIKAILKEYFKDDYDEFNKLYKALAEKMRPMVYELGFLKK